MLNRRSFIVKEKVELMKVTGTYEIIDPENKQAIGVAKETLVWWLVLLRLLISRRSLPMTVLVSDTAGATVLTIKRGFSFIRPTVEVFDAAGAKIGYFKAKLLTIVGGFKVYNAQGQEFAEVKGDWKGWNFKLVDNNGRELGEVTKKWAGLGRELFTTADTYAISLGASAPSDPGSVGLLLGAGLAIDMVFKEGNN
ncbi:MAG: hypothetical protein K1X75_09620 [Leptospirales bacterium]|nr:hypothetical protein [Leptospirales bacterium]